METSKISKSGSSKEKSYMSNNPEISPLVVTLSVALVYTEYPFTFTLHNLGSVLTVRSLEILHPGLVKKNSNVTNQPNRE